MFLGINKLLCWAQEGIVLACAKRGMAELCSVGSFSPYLSVGLSKGDTAILMEGGGFDHAHLQETSPAEGLGCTEELHVMNAIINSRSFLEIEPSSRAK